MLVGLRAKINGFERLFKVQIERLSDLTPPLKETGKEIQEDSRETFAEEKSRSGQQWAPFASATKKRLQHATVSPVTIGGKVRAKYIEKVSSYLQFQQKTGKYNPLVGQEFYRLTHGGSPTEAIDESVKNSFKRLRRELGKTEEKRRKGKRAIHKHGLLGKMYTMIRLAAKKGGVSVGILGNSPLAVQNEGGKVGKGATVPARTFIELLPDDVAGLVRRLGDWIVPEKE